MIPAISQPDFVPFNFEGMRLQEACFINGNPYFTSRAIGEFLEYEHADRAVHKIVERNSHILTFSSLVKLTNELDTGKGRKYEREKEVRVYDPIGLQLIINKSNQPRALAFQIAAAHLVMAFMKGDIRPSKWATRGDRLSAIRQILSHPPTQKRRQLVQDLAEKEQKSLASVYRWIEKVGELKTSKGTKKLHTYKKAA